MNYSKEEQWLNEMSKKGYEVVNNCFGYTFKKINPDNIIYRIDYRTFKSNRDFVEYCTIFEDSGWKHICGSKASGKQYFKKVSEASDDDIFSDTISKAERYKRASKIWLSLALSYFVILMALITTGAVNVKAFLNPKELYLTPGLWEASGVEFIRKFLFETPFALGRGFIWLILPLCLVIYLYCMIRSSSLYKQTLKQQ